jgi:DNA-binding CsgD family transcriptional regulator
VLEPELVAHVAEMPRDDVLDAFDVLCARTVCKSVGPGRWQFRHPLLARVAYDVQSTAARYRAHHAAAEALARSGAPLAAQARHVAVSSPRGDRAAAHTLAAAAGELAAQAPGQAAQWYAAAMDIAPADDGEWLRDVDLARARALVAVGSLDEAHDILHEFLASAPAIDPQRMTATVLAARVAYLLGRHDEAGAILQRELSSNVEWAAADLAAGLVELATARLMGADFGGARDAAQRALDLAPAAERLTVAGAAAALTLGCVASGDVAVGLSHREQAAELVDGLADGELGASLEVGVWLGWAEMFLESVEPARRHLERCLRIARRGAHQHLLTHLLVGWGSVLKIAGDLPGATEAYDEAREAGERVGSAEMTTMATAMQCRAATWRGDLAAAERYGSQAVAMAAERSNWFASVAAALLAQARLVAGEPAGCVDAILRAGGGADLPGFDPSSRCDWWEVAITAAVAEDDLATARDLSGRSRRQADQLPLRTPTGFAMLGDARIALADGDAETGAELAARAADLFGSIGHRLEAARSRQLEALARARGGQRALAIDLLTEVEAVYAQCRAARLRAEARGELRRLGRRVGSVAAPGGGRRSEAAPASVSALSAREREVAVLVAAGRTNRQIAADLVVSEKTVESHLAHIFVKLEVTSRAAVAAAIAAANSP